MTFTKNIFVSLSLLSVFGVASSEMPYQPCPLLRAYYPPPPIQEPHLLEVLNKTFNDSFTQLVSTGTSKYGDITPNTTSFSVVFFSGDAQDQSNPVLFEYHHSASKATVTADTQFLTGDLTQLLTVYHWLVEIGDKSWGSSVTEYLPELKNKSHNGGVVWDEVTVGSLAGQMSGLARTTGSCHLDTPCNWDSFHHAIRHQSPLFHPDTTPVISHSAFQLLSFAIERQKKCSYPACLHDSILKPLKMHDSHLLKPQDQLFGKNMSNVAGEPAALSFVATVSDLARFGNALLASRQLTPDTTRRWLSSNWDTSNLRNGVGRPWQVYRAGTSNSSVSPILDVFNINGVVGPFASYFGVVPDVNVGFAILAHDDHVQDEHLDLNVYADIVSEALPVLQKAAAKETHTVFSGMYSGNSAAKATISLAEDGLGLVVSSLHDAKGHDLVTKYAQRLNIERKYIDFKLYPSNVNNKDERQWIMVFQDKSDPADEGTPTCITWQTVGAFHVPWQVLFKVNGTEAMEMRVPDENLVLHLQDK